MACVDLLPGAAKKVVDELRALGLDKLVHLPSIVVCGDTSAGKSSLLTAISGLEFPSNAGLTTRCPTEVVLSQSEKRIAEVSLRWFEGMTDEQRGFRRVLKEDRSDFGEAVSAATEVLTRGQPKNYITANAIVAKACGPDLCDLTLIDLPGLVAATAEEESKTLIGDVRKMLQEKMSSPRAVILCVLPANNNFHNSAILTMAKDEACDPQGFRTLGIITKPDLTDKGSESDAVDLAENRSFRLELGWHVVKLRSQQELKDKKALRTAEEEEAEFMDQEPWKCISSEAKGIAKLRQRLQEMLLRRVLAELPSVCAEVQQQLALQKTDLQRLGPRSRDPSQLFTTSVMKVAQLVEAACKGAYAGDFFAKAEPRYANNTRAKICQAETQFRSEVAKARFMCLGEYAQGDKVRAKPSNSDGWYDGVVQEVQSSGKIDVALTSGELASFSPVDVSPDRAELRKMLIEMRGDTLPGFGTWEVFRQIVSDKIECWVEPTKRFCSEVVQLLEKICARAVDHSVPEGRVTLQRHLQKSIKQLLQQQAERLDERVSEILVREKEHPYTQNHYYSDTLAKMRQAPLQEVLRLDVGKTKVALMNLGVGASIEESAAVDVEFHLAAYLKVASKRFMDEVPQTLHMTLVKRLQDSLQAMQSQLMDSQLEEIVLEDPEVSRRRERIEQSIDVLGKAARRGSLFVQTMAAIKV